MVAVITHRDRYVILALRARIAVSFHACLHIWNIASISMQSNAYTVSRTTSYNDRMR